MFSRTAATNRSGMKQDPVAVVTGGNTGIGRETARELAKKGYHVVLACRNLDQAESAAQSIRSTLGEVGNVEVGPRLDLADKASIEQFVDSFQKKHPKLEILINNAGCNWAPVTFTPQGVINIVQVNYLGPFYLTRLMEKQLRECRSRVVNVSSVMHRFAAIPDCKEFITTQAKGTYGATKLANVLFSFELQRRSKGQITTAAVDPGGVVTGIWRNSIFAKTPFKQVMSLFFSGPSEGCKVVVHAATCVRPVHIPDVDVCPDHTGSQNDPSLMFYARGLFASSPLTMSPGKSVVMSSVQNLTAGLVAMFDEPLRKVSLGMMGTKCHAVPAADTAYDTDLAGDLWRESCRFCNLPV